MRTDDGFKIYGAGMSSSRTESIFSTDSESPNRLHFDLERIMRTDYRIDDFQQVYFVIDDFAELFDATQQDFGPIYERLSESDKVYNLTEILASDVVHTKGTQTYAKSGGRLAKAP
jgi:phenylalanine-4-hydroxylase